MKSIITIVEVKHIAISIPPVGDRNHLCDLAVKEFNLSDDEIYSVRALLNLFSDVDGNKAINFNFVQPRDLGFKEGLSGSFSEDLIKRCGGQRSIPQAIVRLALFLKKHNDEIPEYIKSIFQGVFSFGERVGGVFISGMGTPTTLLDIRFHSRIFQLIVNRRYATYYDDRIYHDKYCAIQMKF